MKEKKDILNTLKRSDKPSVPEGFFESFSDNLMSKIEGDSFLNELPKREKPEVPDGFFESFSDNLLEKIEATPPKVKQTKVIPLRIMVAVASIAAVFALIVLTTKNNTGTEIASTGIDTVSDTIDELDYDEYLVHLDETSIIDYIVEHDIDIDEDSEMNESIYSEIESELDTYYYGL